MDKAVIITYKCTSRQKLAELYAMDVKTLMTRLKKKGIELDGRQPILPKQIEQIFDELGKPTGWETLMN